MNRIAELRAYLTATDASPAARFVYIALDLHADGGRVARPSITTIARETATSRSTVKRALRELEQRGDIVGEYSDGTATRFTLIWVSGWNPGQSGPGTRATVNPPPGSSLRGTRSNGAQNPVHSEPQNVLNVTTTRDTEPEPERERREVELIEIRAQRAAIVGSARAQHHRNRKGHQ